jgi:hypothetical protein
MVSCPSYPASLENVLEKVLEDHRAFTALEALTLGRLQVCRQDGRCVPRVSWLTGLDSGGAWHAARLMP